MVAKTLEVFDGKTLAHYDIGCSFEETIRQSSLGPAWPESCSRSCPNAFHGYSHSYDCQTKNHPSVIEGAGLEDGETLERIFSASNALASVTRTASKYRRRMLVDAYFQHWDEEKYANISLMLYNNYVQALGILEVDMAALDEAMTSFGVTMEDVAHWGTEEQDYFQTLGQEKPWDTFAVVYVEKLQEYRAVRAGSTALATNFLNSVPADYAFLLPETGPINYYQDASRTQRAETKRRYLEERERVLAAELAAIETKMGVGARWQSTDAEYIATLKYIDERKYHRALDNLQRLVVQRLFELQKMNLSQTGTHATCTFTPAAPF